MEAWQLPQSVSQQLPPGVQNGGRTCKKQKAQVVAEGSHFQTTGTKGSLTSKLQVLKALTPKPQVVAEGSHFQTTGTEGSHFQTTGTEGSYSQTTGSR